MRAIAISLWLHGKRLKRRDMAARRNTGRAARIGRDGGFAGDRTITHRVRDR